MTIDEIQPIVTLIKDIVTGLSALTAAIVAVLGLRAWQEQHKGKAEFELARRVLIAVYKLRDVLMLAHLSLYANSIRVEKNSQYVDDVFSKLENAERELSIELLEAQAVWGDDPRYSASFMLFTGLGQSLKVARTGYRLMPQANLDGVLKPYAVENFDEFFEEIHQAVLRIEDLLRPKLKFTQKKSRKRIFGWFRNRRKS